jgi:hypothetical protein
LPVCGSVTSAAALARRRTWPSGAEARRRLGAGDVAAARPVLVDVGTAEPALASWSAMSRPIASVPPRRCLRADERSDALASAPRQRRARERAQRDRQRTSTMFMSSGLPRSLSDRREW